MATLKLGGVTITSRSFELSQDGVSLDRLHAGWSTVSRGHRGLWTARVTAGPYDADERAMWAKLIAGDGETWMVESGTTYGSRGTEPTGTFSASGSGGKFNGRFSVTAGNTMTLTSDIDHNETTFDNYGWTFRCWRKESAGSWEHYVVYGTGTAYGANINASVDGGAVASATSQDVDHWLTVNSNGSFTLTAANAGGNVDTDFSEVEIRPYNVLAAQAVEMSAVTTEGAPLGSYKATGDGFPQKDPTGASASDRELTVDVVVLAEPVRRIGGQRKGEIQFRMMEKRKAS